MFIINIIKIEDIVKKYLFLNVFFVDFYSNFVDFYFKFVILSK